MPDYDIVVVGAGPGGYVAAIRAGQLGLKTAVGERDELGGICLNWGCIPTKALLRNAEVVELLHRAGEFGISFDNLQIDYGKAVDRSRKVVSTLTRGVAGLLRKNKVEHIKGEARFRDAHMLEVSPSGRAITASNIIIATGTRPRSIPGLQVDGQRLITSREALELRQVPQRIAIIGGGATGAEFAYLYNAYGAEVTIVEMLPHLLPNEDEEISLLLERSFTRQGIKFLTGARVKAATKATDMVRLEVEQKGETTPLEAEQVLVAVGVQANSDGLGLERIGVTLERGNIKVDGSMATNVPGVYAIGDVTGILLLAHVAQAQGVLAVERIAGKDSPALNYEMMPKATYCHPQVTSFGLTEKQAIERGHEVKVGRFPFQASGKAQAIGDVEGMVKVVADKAYGELLGVHMIGPDVTEMLGEMSLARLLEGTTREVGWLVHSHPTLSEALKEAALDADGQAIHI
ncbi:MAG: dihydrolipoyl dehydrogenase [Dehalococcoidia bacterium]|nr:dihydrolipoyl dehydrogenase [Dehalococcoidia bacterium]